MQVEHPAKGYPPTVAKLRKHYWHSRCAGGQLCSFAMCCHLYSSVMLDHALGISCFAFLYKKPAVLNSTNVHQYANKFVSTTSVVT